MFLKKYQYRCRRTQSLLSRRSPEGTSEASTRGVNIFVPSRAWTTAILVQTYAKSQFHGVTEFTSEASKKCSREASASAQAKRFLDFVSISRCHRHQTVQKRKSHPHARWGCDFPISGSLEMSHKMHFCFRSIDENRYV